MHGDAKRTKLSWLVGVKYFICALVTFAGLIFGADTQIMFWCLA